VSLAAKQKSHRPGRPLALSLRAGEPAPAFYRRRLAVEADLKSAATKEIDHVVPFFVGVVDIG
jgi:hypothetical protein